MLPPKDVPPDLEYHDYLRLFFRYQTLQWHRQMSAASRRMLEKQPEGGGATEEGKKRMAVLMTGLEGLIIVRDLGQEVSEHAGTLVRETATHAGRVIDQFEPLKKAKSGLISAFTVLTDTVDETIDHAIESVVLPAFGLPVDGLPEGKEAEEYLEMAKKYESIGLPEPTREALNLAAEVATDKKVEERARVMLKTRIPAVRVDAWTHTKMLNAARNKLLQKPDEAKEIYEEIILEEPRFEWPYACLAMIELTDGDLERTRDLIRRALKLNSSSLKVRSALARVHLAEWKLAMVEKECDKMDSLEPGNEMSKSFREMCDFARQHGLA